MKKILISLSVIVVVAAIAIGGTMAYFSDTETSAGNTISSGALDLTLNGHNNVTDAVVTIDDMKPSQTWYSGPITLNVSNNPGRIYKKIVNEGSNPITCEDVITTEPECEAANGTWNDSTTPQCSNYTSSDYLPDVTWIDIQRWEDFNKDGIIDDDEWVTMLPDQTKTIAALSPSNRSDWIYLGTYGYPMMDNELVIRQSFHMDKDAGNEYQADKCTFTEEFMVTQINAENPTNTYVPPQNVVLDSIDVGDSDSVSMQAHNAQGWLDFSTGDYGGRDGGESIAMVWGEGGVCDANNNDATFKLDAGAETAKKLQIRHYDGQSDDSFEVFVDGISVGTYANQYSSESPSHWITTTFDVSGVSFTGEHIVKIVATGSAGSLCAYHQNPDYYGQVALNWAKITN